SVLDLVLGDATSLNARLGKTDQAKLDEYLTGVRELETQLEDGNEQSCDPGARPNTGLPYAQHVKMMCDLMVLAMQCDVTRIFTFMIGNGLSGRTYPDLGITRGHHEISHHGMNADNLANLTKIATWEMQQLAYLMGKLKGVTDGASGSNLLQNSAIFLSSDISDGDRHNHDEMPVILAGHGGGALKPGRHIAYDKSKKTKVSNLLVTMLGTVGVDAKVGDSDGRNADV
ncbi:MAG: DUF1552 domain-containing protein, partial [Polyangiales bacterium]